MHVGIVIIGNAIGGSEKRFARLFRYLSNHSRHRYTLMIPVGLHEQLCEQGILSQDQRNVVKLFTKPPYNLFNHAKRIKLFGRRVPGLTILLTPLWRREWNSSETQGALADFDLVHIGLPSPILSKPKNIPVVLEEAYSQSRYSILPSIKRWLDDGAFISCLSESIRDAYVQQVDDPVVKSRLFAAPCSFIDYEATFVAPKERLIAFVGRMEQIKNPELFVSAIEHLSKQRQDFKAVLLGTGNLDARLDKMISQRGLESVLTRQFHPRPQEVLSRSLIFVSLQDFDNYPSQALIEGMACGCAVVASDFGDTERLVSDQVGYRVPLSSEIIAERFDYMLEHFEQTIEMGRAARQKVMREHTIEEYARYLEGLYERAMESS